VKHESQPPRLARCILERALPDDVREEVTGDLREMFDGRRRSIGAAAAARWYWRQSASFTWHFVTERLRERRGNVQMTPGISRIDFTLALRMLVRYPGLTVVGVLGMAVGIAIAASAFVIGSRLLDPVLPLDEGDRIVVVQNWDTRTNNRELRSLHDLRIWRETLGSLEEIGAFRTAGRNLIAAGSQPETVQVAEMSASGFSLARVEPLMGRYLLPEDERAGAPDVVVVGEGFWRRRFAADPGILSREIQLGGTTHSIIGVMPAGFAFPLNDNLWIPLRLPAVVEPRSGPVVTVFARVAPGITIESAQAELTALGDRAATTLPATHEHLRPRISPYTHAFSDMDDPDNRLALRAMQSMVVMLLVLISINVAILVYARTATRQGEIAVRTALGASRGRIVAQLFAEALVLAGVAALLGLGIVSAGLGQLDTAIAQLGRTLPFWLDFGLSTRAVMYFVALTVLAASIVGVVPALKATGRRVQIRLQGLSAGSGSRMQMGRLWTAMIVAQVAVTVAILPATTFHAWSSLRFRTGDRGFAADEFLTTQLVMDRSGESASGDGGEHVFRSRLAGRLSELERILETEAAVAQVTFSQTQPGGELAAVVEAEGIPAPAELVDYNIVEGTKHGHFVRFNRIAFDFFPAYDVPLLAGRALASRDADSAVLVNRALVERIFAGASPLGRRMRYVGRSREAGEGNIVLGRWYEIAGVVPDFPPHAVYTDGSEPKVYHVARPGDVYPALMSIRVRGNDPSTFADRVRQVSADVDPTLQLRSLSTAAEVARREQGIMRLIGMTLVGVTLSVVVLSAAGIYALMSFTVARRRREIGIRAALGANPGRILAGIFSRVFAQLAGGVALGIAGALAAESVLEGEMFQGNGAIVLPLVAACTTLVGLLSALGPARRGLQIQPTEALREE
jgi:predicted permease